MASIIFHDAQTSKAAHTKCIEAMHILRAAAAARTHPTQVLWLIFGGILK